MRLRSLPSLLLLAVALLFVVPSMAGFYTDWLWFVELGYEHVFLRSLRAQTMLFGATFAVVFLFLYFNLRFARRRTADRPHIILGRDAGGRPITLEGRRLSGLAMPVAIGVGLLMGLLGANNWLAWLSFFHATPFGATDPLFGREIAFYVFRLPVYQTIREQALVVTVLSLIGCAVYYVFSGSFVVEARPGVSWPRIRLVTAARRHLSLLAALLLALMAWGEWLEIFHMLLTPTSSSVAFGASYADVYARIPFLWATIGVLVLGACVAVWQGFSRRSWPLAAAVALYLAVSVVAGVYAGFVQNFVVTPNEQSKELPYIINNIQATRRAYNLDRVEERELSGDAELTAADIIDNAGTIENVRLWDNDQLLSTFSQIQEIRTYYDFRSVDNDRYMINGKYRQVMLAARELNTDNLTTHSWLNERLVYTHGYGLTLGPVNQITTEGLPVLFIRDLPPISTVDLKLDQPSIYYGEISNSYVLVKTKTPEFHYPRGDDNEFTTYTGTGGVPVGSLLRRLLFALRFTSREILVTSEITRDSRIMFHRQIRDRARLLAPFLEYDMDPYPVVSGGRIFWMQDAYTTTADYPYSTPRPTGDLNYIRNSVKIVTDAYNGDVQFYLADPTDPIVRTISAVFPGLLRPLDEMPPDLRRHVRYPEEMFRVQTQIFATYHMTNPQVFYNKEDQWEVPVLDAGQTSVQMLPYYTIMRLPGERQNEFIQMLPFTPRAKSNLSAWMVARSDGANYGRLVAFQFPKQKIIYGPRQIVGRINQDQVISPQITLWNQQGSEVHQGTLLVIPIKEALLYVRPLYLRSTEGRIPELKRVIVNYQSKIVMKETLTEALVEIFGRSVGSQLEPDRLQSSATSVVQTPTTPAGTAEALGPAAGATPRALAEAQDHYDRMMKAQREGNWALYGEELKKLGDVLSKLNPNAKSPTAK